MKWGRWEPGKGSDLNYLYKRYEIQFTFQVDSAHFSPDFSSRCVKIMSVRLQFYTDGEHKNLEYRGCWIQRANCTRGSIPVQTYVAVVFQRIISNADQDLIFPGETDAAEAEVKPKVEDHVLVGFYSSRALCRLVLLSRKSTAAAEFVRQLWSGALKGNCGQWLGTHADKVSTTIGRNCVLIAFWRTA